MRKTSRDRNEEERRSATTAIEGFEARGRQTPQCSIPSEFRRATFLKRNRYAFLGPNRSEESTSPFDRCLRISTRHLKHCLSRMSCEPEIFLIPYLLYEWFLNLGSRFLSSKVFTIKIECKFFKVYQNLVITSPFSIFFI
jgi:hypothetical protein